MRTEHSLELLAEQVRRCVAQGRFTEARPLLDDFAQAAHAAVEARPDSIAAAGEIVAALEELRLCAISARAHLAVRRSKVLSIRGYVEPPGAAATWEIRG